MVACFVAANALGIIGEWWPDEPPERMEKMGRKTRGRGSMCLLGVLLTLLPGTPSSFAAGWLEAWGLNDYGQSNVPDGSDFVAVTAGYRFSAALKTDGTIVAWGRNVAGECEVPEGNDYVAIAAGAYHGLAIREGDLLGGWGSNHFGQTDVPAGTFSAVAGGAYFSLALRTDGSLGIWGRNTNRLFEDLPGGDDFVAITAGYMHATALRADGSVAVWGTWDRRGDYPEPPTTNDIAAVKSQSMALHTVAIRTDGSLTAWGYNGGGQYADLPAGDDFMGVAVGYQHGTALKSDGSLVGWGRNFAGQADPPDGYGFVSVAGGEHHNLAIRIPEPATLALLGLGAMRLGRRKRKEVQ